jgi:hypothetical protein
MPSGIAGESLLRIKVKKNALRAAILNEKDTGYNFMYNLQTNASDKPLRSTERISS